MAQESPQVESGASNVARIDAPISAQNPSNNMMQIEVYRRYHYSVNPSAQNFISKLHQWHLTITLMPSGNVYTDTGDVSDDAGTLIDVFRAWLLAEIEAGDLSVEVARQYVAVYNFTDSSANPSFEHAFRAMLDACPQTESDEQVDALITDVIALGWSAGDI